MKQVTSEELYVILRTNETISNIHVGNYTLNWSVLYKQGITGLKSFNNCVFDNLKIEGLIEEETVFIKCQFNLLHIAASGDSTSVKLGNCIIETLSVSSFKGSDNLDLLHITGKDSSIDKISINRGVRVLRIEDANVSHSTIFSEDDRCEIDYIDSTIGDISIHGKIRSVGFHKAMISHIRMKSLDLRSHIIFDSCDVDSCQLYGVKSTTLLSKSSSHKQFIFHSAIIEEVTLVSPIKIDMLNISKECSLVLHNLFEDGSANTLMIGELKFWNLDLDSKSLFNFNRVNFENVRLMDTVNDGIIKLRDCSIGANFNLLSSEVNDLRFNTVTIGQNCKVSIIDTDISDVRFNNFKWGNDYALLEKYDPEIHGTNKNLFYLTLRESYRQLKSLFIKNGNKIEALEFQKHELRAHYLLVKRDTFNDGVSGFFRNLGNFLILWTHKSASNFGLHIWKPFILLFIFHAIFFNVFLISNDLGYQFSLENDPDVFAHACKDYFYTLWPTHGFSMKSIESVDVNISGLSDILLRVFSGYFIFYFVTASRKYHGSGS